MRTAPKERPYINLCLSSGLSHIKIKFTSFSFTVSCETCLAIDIYPGFRGTSCLHHEGRRKQKVLPKPYGWGSAESSGRSVNFFGRTRNFPLLYNCTETSEGLTHRVAREMCPGVTQLEPGADSYPYLVPRVGMFRCLPLRLQGFDWAVHFFGVVNC
jgi:hypothetical protein